MRDCFLLLLPGPTTVAAWLCRVPVEGSITESLLHYGAGALDIDACRLKTTDKLGGGAERKGGKLSISGPWARPWMNDPQAQQSYALRMRESVRHAESLGRWPSNLLFVHDPACKHLGSRRSAGTSAIKGKGGVAICRSGVHSDAGGHQSIGREQPVTGSDPDGKETVDAWECVASCPLVDCPDTVTRLYPQFENLAVALRWLSRLVTPV